MKKVFAKIILKYLQILTKLYVKRQSIEIIGLTGSVGKTTLTIAIYEILKTKFKVGMTYKDGKGLNSETGLPFAFLGIDVKGYSMVDWLRYVVQAGFNFLFKKFEYDKMVVEMGVDKPGDMDFLLSMIEPKVGVFLSIAKVHGENFEHLQKERGGVSQLDLIFNEKAKLIRAIDEEGTCILNVDNKRIKSLVSKTKSKILTFGITDEADIRGIVKSIRGDSFEGEVIFEDQMYQMVFDKYMINRKLFTTLLAAISVGVLYGIDTKNCIEALEDMKFPPGRMSKFEGVKKTVIIDSSYNASKPAVIEALNNLSLFTERKKIAVLGDMRELGKEAKSEHEEIARKAVKVADEIVAIGPAMRDYFIPQALSLGYNKEKIHLFSNTWKALDYIKKKLLKGGEVVLVKGSQNTLFLEIIVEGLLRYKSKRKELCRRH